MFSNIIDISFVAGKVLGKSEPVNGFRQAIAQCILGCKTGQAMHLGVVAAKAEYFGVLGTQAVFGGDDIRSVPSTKSLRGGDGMV